MKFVNSIILIGLSGGFWFSGEAYAQQTANFTSIHQTPFSYSEITGNSPDGSPIYTTTDPLIGFKNQYAPMGISGCRIGYDHLKDLCQSPGSGVGVVFPGYTSVSSFKIYIPAGVNFFSLSGFLPQASEYAVAAKLGSPPARVTSLTSDEYLQAQINQNLNTDFSKLLAGQELIRAHEGGGAMSFVGTARLGNSPTTAGQWLYVRVLNGGGVSTLSATYRLDPGVYKNWYDGANFGTDGDPATGVGPVTPPKFEDFALSNSSWRIGSGPFNLSLTTTHQPGAALPQNCTVSPSGVLTVEPAQGTTAKVSIDMAAAEALAHEETEFTFTCKDKQKTFLLLKNDALPPIGATARISAAKNSASPVLTLEVKHPPSEVAQGGRVKYYVVGLVPARMFGDSLPWVTGDVSFFLADYPEGRRWTLLFADQGFEVAAFEKEGYSVKEKQVPFDVPLIFTWSELKDIKAKIRFGYTLDDGKFKALDVIWDPENPNPPLVD